MKRILTIIFENTLKQYLVKDMCAYPYYLGMYYNWDCTYAYFTNKEKLYNPDFEKYCKLYYLGRADNYNKQKEIAEKYIRQHALDYDVICFFNYGGTTYRFANLAKKVNPNIKIYSKLDMSDSGFAHFYDGTLFRKITSSVEIWKSRNVDLFTVENSHFYEILRKTRIFKNRIEYLPNGVSLFGLSSQLIEKNKVKQNIIVSVGRLGIRQKNNQMLVQAMERVDKALFQDWKVYFIGNNEGKFTEYLEGEYKKYPWLKEHVILLGLINDREKLYTIYSKAKIICMTSRWESFGIATIEGMFFGAYPVTTNYGTVIEDITDHRKYGKVVPSEDVDALVKALEDTVQMPDLAQKNAEIQNYARKRYGYRHLAGRLNEYLTDLLTENEGG